jgi:alkanesulfonate monooxygenase SsuD/methylene tetrahydromethanopterin reductase-like flavin-dependent oxidoreductase (luciferase family)
VADAPGRGVLGHRGALFDRGQPHASTSRIPPIIIGGTGPKRTPAIAARYADEFNGAIGGDLRERYAVFDEACAAIGRDPATARRSAVLPVACGTTPAEAQRRAAAIGSQRLRDIAVIGGPQEVTDRIAELVCAGADTVYLHIYDIHDLDHVALIGAEVLPHLAAQQRSGARS